MTSGSCPMPLGHRRQACPPLTCSASWGRLPERPGESSRASVDDLGAFQLADEGALALRQRPPRRRRCRRRPTARAIVSRDRSMRNDAFPPSLGIDVGARSYRKEDRIGHGPLTTPRGNGYLPHHFGEQRPPRGPQPASSFCSSAAQPWPPHAPRSRRSWRHRRRHDAAASSGSAVRSPPSGPGSAPRRQSPPASRRTCRSRTAGSSRSRRGPSVVPGTQAARARPGRVLVAAERPDVRLQAPQGACRWHPKPPVNGRELTCRRREVHL